MKSILASVAFAAGAYASVQGFDISNYQSNVDFAGAYGLGARFVIIKATEGTSFKDPEFSNHYIGATNAGFIRGGYHFAHPGATSGAEQADYFLAHGGGWSNDGITLPGMLDLESGANSQCWGLGAGDMVAWIKDFSDHYQSKTGRYPLLYTGPSWWETCTGNSNAFVDTNPLVLAHYSSAIGAIPGGWGFETIWQYNDAFGYGGDSDSFNGDFSRLQALAKGE